MLAIFFESFQFNVLGQYEVFFAIIYLSVFLKIDFQRFCIIIEAECGHGEKDVFAIDCFTFLQETSFTGFACNETNKFGNAFLNTFTSIFCDLRMELRKTYCYRKKFEDKDEYESAMLTLPVSGIAFFIIFAMLAIGKNLSCSLSGCSNLPPYSDPSWLEFSPSPFSADNISSAEGRNIEFITTY